MAENKPIIINGIDVSECEFCDYKGADIPLCRIRLASFESICDGYNCYYKNWKRKEHECQQLTNKNNRLEEELNATKLLPEEKNNLYTAKMNEYDELKEYHNKCCKEFENEKKELLEKYNQLSRDFYSGKYCNVEKCKQLDQLKTENEGLREFQKLLEEQMKFNKNELELSLSTEIKRSEFLLKEFKIDEKKLKDLKQRIERLQKRVFKWQF